MLKIFILGIIIYFLIGTYILISLLFDKSITFEVVSKRTGKVVDPPTWYLILFCMFWIIMVPVSIKNAKEEE
jgi:succinate dehydrogenase/fumarate reductase cytochrome b subunit